MLDYATRKAGLKPFGVSPFGLDKWTPLNIAGTTGWWKLSADAELTGNITQDFTPYANDGTIINGVTYTADQYSRSNKAMVLDGANDYVDLINSANPPAEYQGIGNNNNYWIFAWIKTSGGAGAEVAWMANASILGLRRESSAPNQVAPFSFGISNNKIQLGRIFDGGAANKEIKYSTISVNDNTWKHIGAVVTDDQVDFYINGVLDNSETFTVATGDCSVGANTSNMQIGCRAKDDGTRDANFFGGSLDNVVLGTGVITSGDILKLATRIY